MLDSIKINILKFHNHNKLFKLSLIAGSGHLKIRLVPSANYKMVKLLTVKVNIVKEERFIIN